MTIAANSTLTAVQFCKGIDMICNIVYWVFHLHHNIKTDGLPGVDALWEV